ncbi:MAG: cation-translocating P-type ATPase [Bacillota bacterium]|jgi:Ca2+-transporting ATPase
MKKVFPVMKPGVGTKHSGAGRLVLPACHSVPWKDIALKLRTDYHQGLPTDEVTLRQEAFGFNVLKEDPKPGPFKRLIAQFSDFLILILIAAAVISAFLGEAIDAIVIGAIVLLNSVIGLIQEGKAEEALKSLEKLSAPAAKVVRKGQVSVIPSREIVPGDIVLLDAGDKVPADIRLIETHSLECNESSLTGESLPVGKNADVDLPVGTVLAERTNIAYSGTVVTAGRGRGIAVATGMNTEMGRIAGAIHGIAREKTPLQKKLARLGQTLGISVVIICAGIFVLGVAKNEPVLGMFMIAVSLAVAAIPEGLPAVVTIVLAMGVKKMASRNGIIRRLPAVETLGSTTVICTDKTGTITQNKMTVVSAFAANQMFSIDGFKFSNVLHSGLVPEGFSHEGQEGEPDHGAFSLSYEEGFPVKTLVLDNLSSCKTVWQDPDTAGACSGACALPVVISLAGAALANDAVATGEDENGMGFAGDPTEIALVEAAENARLHKAGLEHLFPRVSEIPFDSDRKRMTTVHRIPQGKFLVLVKGAPEVLMPKCRFVFEDIPKSYHGRKATSLDTGTGNVMDLITGLAKFRKPVAGQVMNRFREANSFMAVQGIRVIAVACKIINGLPDRESGLEPELESELTLTGLLGMMDPPRPEAKESVAKAKEAGITPILITGDNPVTALSVARMVGIATHDTRCMSGPDLAKIGPGDLVKMLDEVRVYGRVSPEHKVKIVDAFKKRGEVVAMTGDGVNDAPALKRADIGISMGLIGTEVAKEASDMVLADDNFATIVGAVEEGRTIYSNIAKFVVYLLSCNMGEIVAISFAMLLRLPVILRPAHILWLNLVTDSFPALALGFEPGDVDAMRTPPRPPNELLLTRERWITVLLQAALIGGSTIGIFTYGLKTKGDPLHARTVAFATLAMAEVFRAHTARSETKPVSKIGVFSNRAMIAGTLISFLLILAVVQIPGLNLVFSTVNISIRDWLMVFGFGLIPALGNELRKILKLAQAIYDK